MAKIKFYETDFLNIGDIVLKTVISMTNKQQTGDAFEALVNQIIISYPSEINHLEIILTTELYRHYYGDTEVQEIGSLWITNNLASLDKLKENHIPYTLTQWESFLVLPAYQKVSTEVKQLYETDKHFFSVVHQLADLFSQKMETSTKCTTDFLLEECSVALLLTGYVTYPHKEINGAITYVLNKLRKPFTYVPYTVDYRKDKSMIALPDTLSQNHPLYQQLNALHTCLEQYGIKGRDYQTRYFNNFLRGLEKRKHLNTNSLIALSNDILYAEEE